MTDGTEAGGSQPEECQEQVEDVKWYINQVIGSKCRRNLVGRKQKCDGLTRAIETAVCVFKEVRTRRTECPRERQEVGHTRWEWK